MLDLDTVSDTSVDALEQELLAGEALIAKIRARQARLLARLQTAQIATADGARSMVEWTMARLDVEDATARRLLRLTTLDEQPQLHSRVAHGEISFDRTVATVRLIEAGADEHVVERSFGYDIAGVRRIAARHRRISRRRGRDAFRDRFLAIQPNLDGTSGKLWGQLPGVDLAIVERALQQRADEFPAPRFPHRQRHADALVAIAQDSLLDDTASEKPASASVSVFVDAGAAAATGGEAGAEVAAGLRVGPAALEELLCDGSVQLITVANGRPVAASPTSRAIPPAIRRFVLFRDGGCVVDGCRSRYRLQPHHIVGFADGGTHDPDNLATLCWFHHHVVIHGSGFRLDPDSPPQRRKLLPPIRPPTLE